MKYAVFWDVMPCGSCKNQRFGGTPIPVNLMMVAVSFSETSVLTRATGRNIVEDGILNTSTVCKTPI
jgi:hypothetical protein